MHVKRIKLEIFKTLPIRLVRSRKVRRLALLLFGDRFPLRCALLILSQQHLLSFCYLIQKEPHRWNIGIQKIQCNTFRCAYFFNQLFYKYSLDLDRRTNNFFYQNLSYQQNMSKNLQKNVTFQNSLQNSKTIFLNPLSVAELKSSTIRKFSFF